MYTCNWYTLNKGHLGTSNFFTSVERLPHFRGLKKVQFGAKKSCPLSEVPLYKVKGEHNTIVMVT